jgi:hypothetical protein
MPIVFRNLEECVCLYLVRASLYRRNGNLAGWSFARWNAGLNQSFTWIALYDLPYDLGINALSLLGTANTGISSEKCNSQKLMYSQSE